MKAQVLMFLFPVISILIAWACGQLRIGVAFVVFLAIEVTGIVLFFMAMSTGIRDPGSSMGYLFSSVLVMMFAPWMTFLFGMLFSNKVKTSPLEHAAKAAASGMRAGRAAWNDLDEEKKQKIVDGAKKMAGHGIKYGARVLRRKGHLSLAALILGALHII